MPGEEGPDGRKIPGIKHQVIGLLSGGKDSCFNLMHCIANGHELVCVATLLAPEGITELDSHMFQTVGTSVTYQIAVSLQLPHFHNVIKGTAVARASEYGSRKRRSEGVVGDETEDMFELLKSIKMIHPEITAVASGAILSSYQRVRVEHACSRLDLVSLSYLWQQPQLQLLDRMLASGLRARIAKVAGIGLKAEHVGKELSEIRPLLAKLEKQYGAHPAGEGGEYETLTFDAPLFSTRLRFDFQTIVTDPGEYPVAHMKIFQTVHQPKSNWKRPTIQELRILLESDEQEMVDGLDAFNRESYETLLKKVTPEPSYFKRSFRRSTSPGSSTGTLSESMSAMGSHASLDDIGKCYFRSDRWFACTTRGIYAEGESVSAELRDCLQDIEDDLQADNLCLALHATHITLLLSDMSLFAEANEAYNEFFGISPPSRATIAVPLHPQSRVSIEVIGFDPRRGNHPDDRLATSPDICERRALHVQSISYWAPANIGPYSQAVIVGNRGALHAQTPQVGERVHIAGQIPLLPASLTLPETTPASLYALQPTLAFQHVRKIVQHLRSKSNSGGGWHGWAESCTCWWTQDGKGTEAIKTIRAAWNIFTKVDYWSQVPVLFLRAKGLPRGASVEFQLNMHTGRRPTYPPIARRYPHPPLSSPTSPAQDAEDVRRREKLEPEFEYDRELEPVFDIGDVGDMSWETCETTGVGGDGSRGVIFFCNIHGACNLTRQQILKCRVLHKTLWNAVSAKLYRVDPSTVERLLPVLEVLWPSDDESDGPPGPCVTVIPVLEIVDRRGVSMEAAIEIFGQ